MKTREHMLLPIHKAQSPASQQLWLASQQGHAGCQHYRKEGRVKGVEIKSKEYRVWGVQCKKGTLREKGLFWGHFL